MKSKLVIDRIDDTHVLEGMSRGAGCSIVSLSYVSLRVNQ